MFNPEIKDEKVGSNGRDSSETDPFKTTTTDEVSHVTSDVDMRSYVSTGKVFICNLI